jgi:serine/threonine protein kinase
VHFSPPTVRANANEPTTRSAKRMAQKSKPELFGIETVGRYTLYGEIASGGMATVHFGRMAGAVGFSRPVAVKRLHAQFAKDAAARAMFIDEARLVSRIRHVNVVPTLDVVATAGQLYLVMEYVQGESLARLMRAAWERYDQVPVPIALAILSHALHGLHAAHEATSESGAPLEIVHRDVSPQNILVGIDGIARVLDFGIARAAQRIESTGDSVLKGKIAYMAPEQFDDVEVTRRADLYSAGVVLWELLAGRRLFDKTDEVRMAIVERLMRGAAPLPSEHRGRIAPELDAVVMKALARDPSERFATAREMALALEKAGPLASPSEIGQWVEWSATEAIVEREQKIAEFEQACARPRMESPSMLDVDLLLHDADHGRPPRLSLSRLESATYPAVRERGENDGRASESPAERVTHAPQRWRRTR